MQKTCTQCNDELIIDVNWTEAFKRKRMFKCKSMSENDKCSSFLGVYIAERVLSKVFKDVKTMPYGHSGYDFVCNKGKKIDVKSACMKHRYDWSPSYSFVLRNNQIADYFLCIAFDNREDLNPLHLWLLPADIFNHLNTLSISESTLNKWDEYKLDISPTVKQCEQLK
jgi:hypothetical protein